MRSGTWLLVRLLICLVGCLLVAAWGIDEGSTWAPTLLVLGLTCWALWIVTGAVEKRR